MRILFLALLTVGLLTQGANARSPSLPQSISGTVRVIDGDTISILDQRIRIAAIDACELKQTGRRGGAEWPCGVVARSVMAKLVDGKHIRCAVIDRDQYRRLVAQCFEQDRDVGLAMVAAGMAETMFQYLPRRHGMDLSAYVKAEQGAKARAAGIWSAEIDRPSDFRRSRKPSAASSGRS